MIIRILLLFVVGLAACDQTTGGDIKGRACTEDTDCGPGFDCYRNACFAVCADDRACDAGELCLRHRCQPSQEAPRPSREPSPDGQAKDGMPDVKVMELRAIRHALEEIRDEQKRLRHLIEEAKRAPTESATTK